MEGGSLQHYWRSVLAIHRCKVATIQTTQYYRISSVRAPIAHITAETPRAPHLLTQNIGTKTMSRKSLALLAFLFFIMPFHSAIADKYDDTIKVFRDAGQSDKFFNNAYGYAVFPTIGKGGLVVGGAAGKGRVYVGGKHVGNSDFGQVTVGFQAGGQAYSMIIFFQDL